MFDLTLSSSSAVEYSSPYLNSPVVRPRIATEMYCSEIVALLFMMGSGGRVRLRMRGIMLNGINFDKERLLLSRRNSIIQHIHIWDIHFCITLIKKTLLLRIALVGSKVMQK